MVNMWELRVRLLGFEINERTFRKKINTFKNKEVSSLSR